MWHLNAAFKNNRQCKILSFGSVFHKLKVHSYKRRGNASYTHCNTTGANLGVKCFVNKCSLRLLPKRLIISVQPLYQSSHVFSCTNKIHFGHCISLFKNLTCIGSLMKPTATCFVKWNIMSLKLQVYKTNRTKRMFNK